MEATRPEPSTAKWLRTQLQQTALLLRGSQGHTGNSRLRAELRSHSFSARAARLMVPGSRSAPRMHADLPPFAQCAWMHSQQMPRRSQFSEVHGHISMLIE